MSVGKILEQNSTPEMIELYHIVESSLDSEDITESLASFKQKGAVARTAPQCSLGQSNGFFVWPNKESAFKHAKWLGGLSHLMLTFKIPQSEVKYPEWNLDLEVHPVGGILKRHETEVKNLGIIKCTHYDMYGENPKPDEISVQSISDEDGSIKVMSKRRGEEIVLEQRKDLGEIEAIFMKMVETSPQFLQEYNTGMKKFLRPGCMGALKYQGKKPLKVSSASVIEHTRGTFKEIPIYDSQKKEQVCPFLKAAVETKRISGK